MDSLKLTPRHVTFIVISDYQLNADFLTFLSLCVCLCSKLTFFFKVPLRGDYKRDVEDVKETAIKMLTREYSNAQKEFHLINGYRRVDPRRGAEYILDIGIKKTASEQDSTIRCAVSKYLVKI